MNIYGVLFPCQARLERLRPPVDESFKAPCFADASGKSTGVLGLLWRKWQWVLSPGICDAAPPLPSPGDALFGEGLELEAQWLVLDEE